MQKSSDPVYPRTELVWPGKRTQVERVALPFQVVETINQSRATREETPMFAQGGNDLPTDGWMNKLIWGNNKYVMASLLDGDPSIGLEPLAGKIDLIYIDPPFATGQDFSYRAHVGDEEWLKEASIIEETAYRDTWGYGLESYLQMMYERVVLMRELLAEDGSLYLHLDWRLAHHVRAIGDEVFGPENFRNELIWKRNPILGRKAVAEQFGRVTDTILFFSKSAHLQFRRPYVEREVDTKQFRWDERERKYFKTSPRGDYTDESIAELERQNRIHYTSTGGIRIKYFLEQNADGKWVERLPADSLWLDIPDMMHVPQAEKTGFDTQKPEALLGRIIQASSAEGRLVADFFCGSGTMMAVAEKLGRRWIGCDLSRYAIQVSRKRLLDIPDCRPFQVLNLGKYERKHWQVNVLNGQQEDASKAIADYVLFIVALYRAEPVGGYAHLHGHKAGRWVHVGAADAPVTRNEVMDAVRECQANRYTGLDVLGWEWEMGLHDTIRQETQRMGVDLRLLVIPREVMDRRAVEAGDVHFYEMAYLKTELAQDGRMVTIRLEDFIIPNPDLVPDVVRSKVKRWSDYIDFWAVDWNYNNDTFHNEWQAYRTRKSPTLRLISDPHSYSEPGEHSIVVKVIDIFGNDTTQLLKVGVP